MSERVCSRCDEAKPADSSNFYGRGRGLNSVCIDCCRKYAEKKRRERRRAQPKNVLRPKPWTGASLWAGHSQGETFLKYEDSVSKTALLTAKAIRSGKPQDWAAAFSAARDRDAIRRQVMVLLK